MKYTVAIDPFALADIGKLRAYDRSAIFDTIERILRTAPTKLSKSRIKRLRDFDSPQYRLRVGDYRVFYDVRGTEVYVMRVLAKSAADDYLREVKHEIEKRKRGATGAGNGQDR